MNNNYNIGKKNKIKTIIALLKAVVIIYLLFFILSGICFGVIDLFLQVNPIRKIGRFDCDWARFFYDPAYIIDIYKHWWRILLKSIRLMVNVKVLFLPFIVPVFIIFHVIVIFLKSNYYLVSFYVFKRRVANAKDIEKMNINSGNLMILGKYNGQFLNAKEGESVLCVGDMGTGKTSSVAIPSILKSDKASIVAVDMSGVLPKYTAGYRAKKGKVIYFNWDLSDDPKRNIYYPRWNPLAEENIPEDKAQVDKYIKRIAMYLINPKEKANSYFYVMAHKIMTAILTYWVNKVYQAKANDYFLSKIIENKTLNQEDKDILLSYYIKMPEVYVDRAINCLKNNEMNIENYVPVGSWGGILEQWCGKDVCFAGICDWLINNYMMSCDEVSKDWDSWLVSLIKEERLFAYDKVIEDGLKEFLSLSKKQRKIIFALLIKPLVIFTDETIRERTAGNDFNIDDIKGIYNESSQKKEPVTIYSLANTNSSKIMNQMFIEEIIYRALNMESKEDDLPIMLVLDDVGSNLKINNLKDVLTTENNKISALLLSNGLEYVENTYSKSELEDIVVNTHYKIIRAENNRELSEQLMSLAKYATTSLQIAQIRDKRWKAFKNYQDDSQYFMRLAKDFEIKKNIKFEIENNQLVLVKGYYSTPIWAESVSFFKDQWMKRLAVLNVDYILDDENIAGNEEDLDTPKFAEVFNQSDMGIKDAVELDQYMSEVFNEAKNELESKKNIDTKEETAENEPKEAKDGWWMQEDAFELDENEEKNPFRIKK